MIDAAELKSIFEKEYNRTDWLHALREIFHISNLHAVPETVELPTNDFDARAMEMGFFETSEGLLIGIFEVTITPNIPLERHKVGLRNMMRNVYKRDMDAALIVFTQGSSWRFSYASELTVANKETGKREKRQTDPKRYTYLLGTGQHCRTAAERFAKLKSTTDLFDSKVSISEIEKAFSVDILTKDFYRELSNWYFWALNHVTFPDDDEPNDEARNPSNLIRLITRLIFVWFLKQKGLVPDSLFDKEKIWPHLNFGYETESNYYKAILQNLFFATLNQEMNKRSFRRNGQHYNITNLYRYRKLFKNPDETIELFKNIPFLNGGLFECLDKPHPTEKTPQGNEKIVRIDGFSDRDDNPLQVPDFLFFGGAEAVDLSKVYDDNRQKNVHVRGIIEILNSYNFTVEENTPLEIQVALDPELLGKVFENLLASYNPETKTTARKQTGSFYTPREIVNYMVDESLMAYLNQKLTAEGSISEEEMESKLRELVSYSGNGNPFDETETQSIVKAIDHIKVLDPACGSGAFPMGILQQLVHVLQKLDPDNKLWKQLQMQRAQEEIEEAIAAGDTANFAERLKEIADAFENNAEDYGRKLYLIENCIYGVDIQPIAVQIAKLRFFISLLVDQTINSEADNLGIRALPNLETKFVAANSLIPINRQGLVLRTNEVIEKEKALKQIRHKYFIARTPEQKRKMRAADEKLREAIAQIIYNEALGMIESNQALLERKQEEYQNSSRVIESLKQPAEIRKYKKNLTKLAAEIDKLKASIMNPDVVDQTAKMLAGWNPYEQNRYAGFFDSEWMFGIKDGFDVVIGNPPYASAVTMARSAELKSLYRKLYPLATGSYDIFVLFLYKTIEILNKNGVYSWIIPNKFLVADYAAKTKKYLIDLGLKYSVDVSTFNVFENASVYPIVILGNCSNRGDGFKELLLGNYTDLQDGIFEEPVKLPKHQMIKDFGFKLASGSTGFEAQKIKKLLTEVADDDSIPFTVSGCIDRFSYSNTNLRFMGLKFDTAFVRNSDSIAASKWRLWKKPKIVIAGMTKKIEAVFVNKPLGLGVGVYAIYDWGKFDPYLVTGILNSEYLSYYIRNKFKDKHLAGGYLAINKSTLEKLPFIESSSILPFRLLSQILHCNGDVKQKSAIKLVLDSIVLELFFSKHMKERGLNILEFVERDINELMQGREFEMLSDSEKEQVLVVLHNKWSHPENELLRRMSLFKEKSPNILKVILESDNY